MIVMAIDGVLRDINTQEVVPSGRMLYRLFAEGNSIALLSSVDDDEKWLASHDFAEHHYVAKIDPGPWERRRRNQLSRIRTRGSIDFVIESDAYWAAVTLHSGYPVMFFAAPTNTAVAYARGVPVLWETLIQEIGHQKAIKGAQAAMSSAELV